MLQLGRGAWGWVKNTQPLVQDAKAIVNAVRHPFQTAKAAIEGTKAAVNSAAGSLARTFAGGASATAKRVWEFGKQRLNPKNYELDGWNVNFKLGRSANTVGDIGVANQIIKGQTTRAEMSYLRNMVKEQAGTKIIFGSKESNKLLINKLTGDTKKVGNFFDPATNEIHLVSASRNQPRGMITEEIQHAIDNAIDPNLNNLNIMSNKKLHSGTFQRMAENELLPLSEAERGALMKKSLEWGDQ